MEHQINTVELREGIISNLLQNNIPSIRDYNPNDRFVLIEFEKIIKDLDAKIIYIKSGATGHTFRIEVDKMFYAVKVSAYPKRKWYGSPYDENRPENAEIKMIKLLSDLVYEKGTPHILLPIAVFSSPVDSFAKFKSQIDNKGFNKFIKLYEENQLYSEACVLISEWARSGDLLEFIRENFKVMKLIYWQVIFFQLFFTLAVIHERYPSFRHNDLKANNILIQKVSGLGLSSKTLSSYSLGNTYYRLPNLGFSIQLCDFDFASIPGVVDNDKVRNEAFKKVNILPEQNRYCDIHFFCISLIHFVPDFMERHEIPYQVKDFIYEILPSKYRYGSPKVDKKTYRILSKTEFTTPQRVIEDNSFFKLFRIGK